MRTILLTVLVALLAWSAPGQAITTINGCHYCSNEDAWRAAAEQRGLGDHYLYNRTNAELRRYHVFREDIAFGQWTYIAWPAVVDADLQELFQNFMIVLDYLDSVAPHFSDSHFTIPVDQAVPTSDPLYDATIYDVLANSSLMNSLRDIISARDYSDISSSAVRAAIQAVLQNLNTIAFGDRHVEIRFTMVMKDGGSLVMRLTPNHPYAQPIEGTARDASGHSVPQSHGAVGAGQYNFENNPQDIGAWINWMSMLGVSINSGGSGNRWSCSLSNNGQTITCSRI